MHGSAQSQGSEQFPRGSILEPLCHGSVEMMSRAVNDFYLEHWPFPDEKARKKFVIAGFPTVTCLYFPKGLESRMPQACSLLSILFLIDDQLECMSLEEGKAYNDRLKPLCRGESLPSRSDPVGWIMYDLWESMRATEPELAHGIIEPLFAFMDAQTSNARLQINDISQYLEYRQADVGQALLAALTRYTMNLHISVEELESVADIEENCGRHISLVNDIYSYEKEVLASRSTTQEGAILCNAVQILANQLGIGIAPVKYMLWILIREEEYRHQELVKRIMATGPECTAELQAYIHGLEYHMSGNELWSRFTKRYSQL